MNPSAVYDGDTLTATCPQGRVKVRVWGIDAPEMGQKPWGNQARDLLRDLVPARIRLEVKDRDRYGRTVARVLDGDRDLGLELVRRGAVVVYERYNDSTAYRRAQSEARRREWGVWAREGSQQNPAAWRRVNARSS
ncbi:MAG: thermonuclease family protein [Candidatus Competibacterales bacterium]